MHGQAASALSEVRSRYILDPISIRANHPFFWVGANFPGLGRGMRGPKQALDWLRAVCADPNRHSIGFAQCARPKTGTRLASRSVRGPKQALDWLRAVCAAQNRHSIGFAQCARTQTGTRLASRSVRGPKQALDWGVRDACQVCRVQSKFHLILVPGKLPQPRQRPAQSQTEVCFASADVRGPKQRSVCFSRCARAKQRSVWPQSLRILTDRTPCMG